MIADIVALNAPSSAPAGETVIIDVSVKNVSTVDQYIAVTAVYDSTSLPFQFDYLLVSPGQTVLMRGSFRMPAKSVKITAWSWYWDGSQWIQDDQGTKDIALATVTPLVSDFRIADYYKA